MVDFATLGLAIDTSGMEDANADLDRFVAGSSKAEAAATRLEGGVKRTGAGMATAGVHAARTGQAMQGAALNTANLGAQFNDIGVMLASGQSPLLLALQQGTQVNQVFDQMAGGGGSRLGALRTAFLSIISPANLMTIGIIAGGAALAQWAISAFSAAENTDRLKDDIAGLADEMDSIVGATSDLGAQTEQIIGLEEGLAAAIAVRGQQLETVNSAAIQGLQQEINLRRIILEADRAATEVRLANLRRETEAAQEALAARVRAQQGLTELNANASDAERLAVQRRLTQETLAASAAYEDQFRQLRAQNAELRLQEALMGQIDSALDSTAEGARATVNTLQGADISPLIGQVQQLSAELNISAAEAAQVVANLQSAQVLGLTDSAVGPDDAISQLQNQGRIGGELAGVIAVNRSGPATARRGGGGGGGARGGVDQVRQETESRLEALRDGLMSEAETVEAWRLEQNETLAKARELELIGLQEHEDLKAGIIQEAAERRFEIESQERRQTYGLYSDFFGSMADLARTGGDRLLSVSKGFAIAQSLINSYQAFTEVLKDPSFIGRPFQRTIAAGAVLASGLAQVQNIRNTSAGGGSGVGGGGFGQSGISAAPAEAPAPRRVLIEFTGQEDWLASMFTSFTEQLQDGSDEGVIYEIARA